jgi:hypothetical protein
MVTPVYSAIWVSQTNTQECVSVHWRDLTLSEHQKFRASRKHPRIVFCDIYETCLVEGPTLDQVPAGIVAWIARQQLDQNPFSGKFVTIHNALGAARQRVGSSWFHAAKAVLASTFRYTFEEIEKWPPDLFFERVAQAELLTGVPLEPADPDQQPQDNMRQTPNQKGRPPKQGNVDRRPQTEVENYNFTRKR